MDLADLLECSICLEQLDESNKVLPCQHTFCTKCLKDIFQKKSSLLCPECRKPVDISIDALPPNILANRILEGITRKSKSSASRSQPDQTNVTQPPLGPLPLQPALPLPKRPATKPEVSRKPPAVTPEETSSQDKTGNYINITHPNNNKHSQQSQQSQSIITQSTQKPSQTQISSANPQSQGSQTLSPPALLSPIPGNHSTNPFLDFIQAEDSVKDLSESLSGMSGPNVKPASNILTPSNDQNLIQSLPLPAKPAPRPPTSNLHQPPLAEPPKVPERPKHTLIGLESTKLWQLSPRALIQPLQEHKTTHNPPQSSSMSSSSKGSIYKALFDYSAKQADELSLKKGEFYSVSEMCVDGWYKGQSLRTGKAGVFPGNHVLHVEHGVKSAKKTKEVSRKSVHEVNLIDLSDEEGRKDSQREEGATETDEERLEKLKKIRDTLRQNHQQNIVRSQAGASSASIKTKGDRYRCIVAFPASSEYEIDLQMGDVISLVKRRDDGWCKGTLHRTGKTGLFPASFVEKI